MHAIQSLLLVSEKKSLKLGNVVRKFSYAPLFYIRFKTMYNKEDWF